MSLETTSQQPHEPNFHEKVQKEKLRTRQENAVSGGFDQNQVNEYLKSVGGDISEETIRELFMLRYNESVPVFIDGIIPNMQDTGLDQVVIHEIESVFMALPQSARTPEQLVQTITYYIKSHMKYDVISLIQLLPRMENELKTHCEELVGAMETKGISIDPQALQDYLSGNIHRDKFYARILTEQSHVDLSQLQMDQIGSLLENLKGDVRMYMQLPKDIRNTLDELMIHVKNKDKDAVTSLLRDGNKIVQEIIVAQVVEAQISEKAVKTINLLGEYSLYQHIKEMKVGVCRHFSLIAKKLYQNCSHMITSGEESELLFVLNEQEGHAYNVLIKEGPNGSLEKKYLDITTYLSSDSVWKKENDMYGSDNELFVENIQKESDARVG